MLARILLQLYPIVSLVRAVTTGRPGLIVNTSSGLVSGYLDTTTTPDVPLLKWLGIPFAQDTSGNNRWKPPQPISRSNDVLNASSYGPACLQGRYFDYNHRLLLLCCHGQ